MVHYVYRLEDSKGCFYIGARSCKGDPEQDRYMGSGNWCSGLAKLYAGHRTKKIIAIFYEREDANKYELTLILANWGNPKCMNEKRSSVMGNFGKCKKVSCT